MVTFIIREPEPGDQDAFIAAMKQSESLHHPWVQSPKTPQEFQAYLERGKQKNQKYFLLCNESGKICGVFNLSEIVRGLFQNAFLGFYAVSGFSGKGHMSTGLKLVLAEAFNVLKLHRIEANIQPENIRSIELVRRNGFRCEGYSPRYLKVDDEWRGHEHWAITAEEFIRNDPEVLKKDHVNIVPYNPEWPAMAKDEIKKISEALPLKSIIDIQHFGSTAISGTSAKPIIDIQIAVTSLDDMKIIAVPALQRLGYEYWAENPDLSRMFFVKGMPPFGEQRTHHIHIFSHDSDHWRNKIAFRDYLRTHPETAKEYEKLKYKLADENMHDREKYTDKKLDFINKILKLTQKSNG